MGTLAASGLHGWRAWAVGLAAVLALAWLGGCFREERSAAAVCDVFKTKGKEFHDKYERNNDKLRQGGGGASFLAGIAQLGAAPGELADLMSKMADVAPKDVEPAFKKTADALNKSVEKAGEGALNPLTGIANSLALTLSAGGAFQEVDRFLAEHCEVPT